MPDSSASVPGPIQPTAEVLARVVPTLNQLQYVRLLRVILGLDKVYPDGWQKVVPLTVTTQLRVYLYEWLVHLGFLNEANIRWLMDKVDSNLQDVGQDLISVWPKARKSLGLFSVCDRRFCNLKTRIDWYPAMYDVTLEKTLDKIPDELAPVTYVCCDLPALFIQKQRLLGRLVAEQKPAE